MSEVSKAPAWSPCGKASPSRSAQRFLVMSAQHTLAPAFFASSTAVFRHSMCPGSRWMLAMATARNFLAADDADVAQQRDRGLRRAR